MSKKGVILMTALVPTKGHQALIEFANKFCDVTVIISTRSHEPTTFMDRVMGLEDQNYYVDFFEHADDAAPQNPSTDEEWDYWKKVVTKGYKCKLELGLTHENFVWPNFDYYFASEPYGKKMAELIGAQFIPFDPDRLLFDVKGTTVRHHLLDRFDDLTSHMQFRFQKKIVLFGQESCGKTTMTKELNKEYNSYMIHEFARPYLEFMDDKTVTDAKMEMIADGQIALESVVPYDRPFVFMDTDYLSTIGYYRIYKGKEPEWLSQHFRHYSHKDLYIVMNDGIPFEEDDLRYGGKVRESTRQFWIDLLEEFGCNYYVLKSSGSIQDQLDELYSVIDNCFHNDYVKAIAKFERD